MPARRRLVLVSPLLIALGLTLACRGTDTTPPPDTTPASTPTVPEVIEWLLGAQVRGPKTRNRGHVGIAIYDLSAAEPTATMLPGSCAPNLVQLIPTPDRSSTRFAIDESGQLLRNGGAGWSLVPSAETLPLLDELVAFSTASSRLELLVQIKGKQRKLTLLALEGDADITGDER